MAIKVKAHRRGRSIVKAYTRYRTGDRRKRILAITDRINERLSKRILNTKNLEARKKRLYAASAKQLAKDLKKSNTKITWKINNGQAKIIGVNGQ